MFHSVEDVDEIPRLTRLLGKDARKRPKRKNLGMEASKKSVRAPAIASQLAHSLSTTHREAPATTLTGPGRCMSTLGSNIASIMIGALVLVGFSALSPCRQHASTRTRAREKGLVYLPIKAKSKRS